MKRKGSAKHQFVQRIPTDVKGRAIGLTLEIPIGPTTLPKAISDKTDAIRVSLRTSDPQEVKARQAVVIAYLESVWNALRASRPIALPHRQAVALAKEIYDSWAKEGEAERGADWRYVVVNGTIIGKEQIPFEHELAERPEPDSWAAVERHLEGLAESDLGAALDGLVARTLSRKGLANIDAESRAMVARALYDALRNAIELRHRQAKGDYSPDPNAARFPEWTPPGSSKPISQALPAAVSLISLVEDWWKEAQASGRAVSTYESYRNTVGRLKAFLKHDDAAAIKPEDIVAFKDHRLAEGVSPKTVGDSDIAGLRSIFAWAVGNLRLPSNPAEKVRVTRSKAVRSRSKDLTPAEAKAILSKSLHHRRTGKEAPKMVAAKRWVPWLCAYTGARLGEMVQLRKQDVRKEGENWVATITPEAGTVKDKEMREVVLHEHLLALGFPAFVEAAPDGYLFLTAPKDGDIRGTWRTTKNRIREFAREVVTDPNVAPNHGWRHLFKTVGREAGIADSVLDAICGHASKTVGGSYGGVTLKAQADAMAKFPRFYEEVPVVPHVRST